MATNATYLRSIKLIGRELTARVVEGEFRVSFSIPAIQRWNGCEYNEARERNEAVAYYTNDGADAFNTAQQMYDDFIRAGRI